MKVSIVLYKSKSVRDIDNLHPVMIRLCHNGKIKYKSTSVNAKSSHWNNIKCRVTCRDILYKEKNDIIYREYSRILNRVAWFEDNNEEYNLNYIVSNDNIELYTSVTIPNVQFNANNFLCIVDERIKSYDRLSTKENYQIFKKILVRLYGDFIDVRKINQVFANDFRERINREFPDKPNHKNNLIKCFSSSYKYGASNRWILQPYVFEVKKFPYQAPRREISYTEITTIINLYKKDVQSKLPFNEYKGFYIFILDIAFQGLAPVDLSKLKLKDLKFETIYKDNFNVEKARNNTQYFLQNKNLRRQVVIIDTYRTKTNTHVPICCDYLSIKPILDELMDGRESNDFLIDCFDKDTYEKQTEYQKRNRCRSYFHKLTEKLNNHLQINERIFQDKTPLTFYFARKGFINALDKLDVPHDLIRKMVGHRNKTLENSYINKPTDWEQSEIIYQLFNNVEKVENLYV